MDVGSSCRQENTMRTTQSCIPIGFVSPGLKRSLPRLDTARTWEGRGPDTSQGWVL